MRGLTITGTSAGTITLTWNSVEGGKYTLQSSTDLNAWNPVETGITATGVKTVRSPAVPSADTKQFYRAKLDSLSTYEGGIRVPLIIAGPAVVSPNRTSTTRVSCVDLYATILELAGINVSATQPAANPLDSRSLLPLLQNQPEEARTVFSQDFSADLLTTGLGATGRMVNGVSMFDSRDAFSYSAANNTDATPGGSFTGDGIWNRDGYHNEGVTFDPALAHHAGNNYHYHAQPKGLRHQLGDHVDYNAVTNTYTESAAPVTKHSPIVAWALDGLPVYGPYGYSDPASASSGLRRMVSGFVLRNGANDTANLTVRQVLPLWSQRIQNRPTLAANQYGPAVNATYLLGHYIEDFDYLGDLGFTPGTHFDLNEQNARFCVTPEFPAGTWAYFTTLNADGTPAFPYTTGRQYYGSPTGGAVTAITETVSTAFIGGPLKTESAGGIAINKNNGNVTMTWSAVEGGTYQVQASSALASWTALTPSITAIGDDSFTAVDPGRANAEPLQFYRPLRTGLAAYDKTGFAGTYFTTVAPTGGGPNTVTPNTGTRGTAVSVVIQLDPALTPNLPPANAIVFSVTVSGTLVTSSALSRPSQTIVLATFTIDAAAATGARDVNVRFGSATGVQRNISGAFNVF